MTANFKRCLISGFGAILCFASIVSFAQNVNSTEPNATQETQPNVIFVLVDDLGWGDLGVFHQNGSKRKRKHKTPFLDRMAKEGMQLRAHYCPAPVCAPSRASLLTGVHQGHASVRNNQFDKVLIENHTLGSVMQAAGYKTAMIGKYGLQGKGEGASSWPGYPTKRGFDDFFGYVRHGDGHVHYPADTWPLGNSEKHKTPKQVWWNDKEVSASLQKCYTTDLFTARSKQWIIDHRSSHPDQPFFLFLAYDTPHAALQVPTVAYPDGKGLKGGLQWTNKPGAMINTATGTMDSYRHPDYVGHGWTDVEERFATMVRRIDNAIGDLLQTLKDLEIDSNTMVVFTSDNGPHHESYLANEEYNADSFQSYGPFDGTKRDTWEGGIRMPTIAWWPQHIPAGQINNRASQFHDWMPTLAEVGGVVTPARSDGVSLMQALTNRGGQSASTIYIEYQQNGKTKSYDDFRNERKGKKRGQMQVIHLDGFKGIRTNIQSHSTPFEIYDLNSDPGERNNLAGSSPEFEQLQQKMKDRVLRIRIPNRSAKRPYDNELIPGLGNDERKPEQVTYWGAKGDFPYVPNFQNSGLGSAGHTLSFKDSPIAGPMPNGQFIGNINVNGAAIVTTWISVVDPGEHTLEFSSPTRGFVRLHDAGVIDADFGYEPGTKATATVNLGIGYHPVTITLLNNVEGGRFVFDFKCEKK